MKRCPTLLGFLASQVCHAIQHGDSAQRCLRDHRRGGHHWRTAHFIGNYPGLQPGSIPLYALLCLLTIVTFIGNSSFNILRHLLRPGSWLVG